MLKAALLAVTLMFGMHAGTAPPKYRHRHHHKRRVKPNAPEKYDGDAYPNGRDRIVRT